MAGLKLDLIFVQLGSSPTRETELWVAQLGCGQELRIIKSVDPIEIERIDNKPTVACKADLHLSCSVGKKLQQGAFRKADEFEFPAFKEWAEKRYGKKLQEEPNQGENPHVRHLWEVK